MKPVSARKSPLRVASVVGPVSLALLACYANACGGGSTAGGGNGGGSDDGGSSSGYSTSSSSSSSGVSSSSSGSGDDAGNDATTGDDATVEAGDDGSGGSSSGSGEGGSSGAEAGVDEGGDSGGSSSGVVDSGGSSSGVVDSGGSSSGVVDSGGSSSGVVDSGGSSSGVVDSGGSDTGSTCNLTGAWALKVTVPVSWPGTGLLNAGTGVVHIWALVQGTQSGLSVPGTVLPCGLQLPDFGGLLPETYGVTFANSLFDGTDLTAVAGAINVSTSNPGGTFTSPATANLIGISFANPVTATWPNLATAQADQVDMDHDSFVGVTATPKTGSPGAGMNAYANPPLNLLASARADSLYMALRAVITLNGTLNTCTTASGAATNVQLNDHIIGCHVAGGNGCSTAQTTFVDSNSPVLAARTGLNAPTFSAQKLAVAATCPNVRSTLP